MDAKSEAQALHLAIAYHAASTADAVVWADRLISGMASPPEELIAISLATHLQEGAAIDLLSAVPGKPNPQQVARLVLGYINQALSAHTMTGREAAAALEHMALNGWVPNPEAESLMYTFDDQWMLAQQGRFGSTDDVRSEIAEFVKQYAI